MRLFKYFISLHNDWLSMIPLIQIHGGETKCMVGNQTHSWWGAHMMVAWPASRPALVGGQVGWGPEGRATIMWAHHRVWVHLVSPPCIWIKDIRYQVSTIRYQKWFLWNDLLAGKQYPSMFFCYTYNIKSTFPPNTWYHPTSMLIAVIFCGAIWDDNLL